MSQKTKQAVPVCITIFALCSGLKTEPIISSSEVCNQIHLKSRVHVVQLLPVNQWSCSVMSDSLRPHGLQHARLPCSSLCSEFAQTHVHWVGDAIQPSCLLLPSSPSAFNLSQHQGLFQWVGCYIKWPKYWRFSFSLSPSKEWVFRVDFL